MDFKTAHNLAKRIRKYNMPCLYVDGILCGIPDTNDDDEVSGFCHILELPSKLDVTGTIVIDPEEFYNKFNGFFEQAEIIRKEKKIKPALANYVVLTEEHLDHYKIFIESETIEEIKPFNFKVKKFDKLINEHFKIFETCERYYGIIGEDRLMTEYDLDVDIFNESTTGIFNYYPLEHDGETIMVPLTHQMFGGKKIDNLKVSLISTKIESTYQYIITLSKDNIIEHHSAYIMNFSL